MTNRQLSFLKERLLEKRKVLIRRIKEIKNDLCDPIGRPDRDSGDRILAYNRRNFLLSQSSRIRLNLRLIENALERMKEGTYGQCSECGTPIESRRISAVPWAHLCFECQEQEEKLVSSLAGRTSVRFPKKRRARRHDSSGKTGHWLERRIFG
ncbi:MAG: TraR/DksA family transcriptional regulator [bacterium]